MICKVGGTIMSEGQALLEYACDKFQEQKYDEALEAFVLAYCKGYEKEWIIENIYKCYMGGNEEEFRRVYNQQRIRNDVSFEECILDFIPYRDGEYYIFDKEMRVFRGKFSFDAWKETKRHELLEDMEYSAAVVELEWNWNRERSILVSAKERKVYIICSDIKRGVSFCKIPELADYIKNLKIFSSRCELQEYFHDNTSIYLPKIIVGSEELVQIINQEHEYRITEEGRNTQNILLTIGIPTHDRGNLLLQRLENLQKMPYDAEVEIVISKNGTHYFQEEYKSVESIKDSRINYKGYNKEITMSENWYNVIKNAKGKYVLIVSDEDDVILEALEHYLKYLSTHEDLGVLRSRTTVQYKGWDKSQYFKKGKEAFLAGFLLQNYLSGLICNRQLLMECNIEHWNKLYNNNGFYRLYPHMWWQALMSFKGDYATDNVYLICEGDSVLQQEALRYRADNVQESGLAEGSIDWEYPNIPVPSTYKARLEQFRGCVILIKSFFVPDDELKPIALLQLINKTLYLMEIVRDIYKTNEFPLWVEKLVNETIQAMEELQLNPDWQKVVLENLISYTKIS